MPNAADTISLGFYNVENLFGLADQGNEYPEFRPGSGSWNKQLYEIKVERIASVIAAMHLDIIGLSEVQNKGTLRDSSRKHGGLVSITRTVRLPTSRVSQSTARPSSAVSYSGKPRLSLLSPLQPEISLRPGSIAMDPRCEYM